jgi:phosphohistidine phosphatase
MNLFLARHGEPEKNKEDRLRSLTEKGKTNLFSIALNWKSKIENIDLIIASPYKRTKQTAEIIKIIFDLNKDIIFDSGLEPGCNSQYIEELLNIYNESNILIVGHMPELSYHVSYFTKTNEMIEFSYATMVKISFTGERSRNSGIFEFKI